MGNRSPIVMEGFLLQARNIHLFIPIFLVVVAYTTLSTLGYSTVVEPLLGEVFRHAQKLWFWARSDRAWSGYAGLVVKTRLRAGLLVAASTAYLLVTALTGGPAVLVVAVSAAVTACSGERRRRWSSFHALVRKQLSMATATAGAGGGLMNGPFGTALLGHVLHAVACRGAVLVFGLYTAFFLRYTSYALVNMKFILLLLGHVVALCVELVCTLAVVVSAVEPAGCFYGVRALRQAWRVLAQKTTPAVILVLVKAAVTAVLEALSIRVYIYPIHFYYVLTRAYAILPRFVSISLYAALQLWFVCATTLYYYQCRQHKGWLL